MEKPAAQQVSLPSLSLCVTVSVSHCLCLCICLSACLCFDMFILLMAIFSLLMLHVCLSHSLCPVQILPNFCSTIKLLYFLRLFNFMISCVTLF